MAITAYVGLPGSGKSYGVVSNVIAPALIKGHHVVTNIPLNQDALEAYCDDKGMVGAMRLTSIDIDAILKAPETIRDQFPAGSTLVVDECWRLWPSGMTSAAIPISHREMFAEHRHMVGDDGYSSHIILVTQGLDQIASFVRNLVDETYMSVKLDKAGLGSKFRIDVYQGAVTGQRPSRQAFMRSLFGTYKQDVFNLYKSHTKSETGDAGLEEKIDSRASMLKHPMIRIGLPVSVLAIPFLIWWASSAFMGLFGDGKQAAKPKVVSRSVTVIDAQTGVETTFNPKGTNAASSSVNYSTQLPLKKANNGISSQWRVGGVLQDAKGERRYVILRGKSYVRRIHAKDCKFDDELFGELECKVDGETVTMWSGQGTVATYGQTSIEARQPVPAPPGKKPGGAERSEATHGPVVTGIGSRDRHAALYWWQTKENRTSTGTATRKVTTVNVPSF